VFTLVDNDDAAGEHGHENSAAYSSGDCYCEGEVRGFG
jgi:hypothetical protein